MVVPFQVLIESDGFTELTVRAQRQVGRAVHYAIAKHWRDKMLPLHFRGGASTRYNYQRRKQNTGRRKKQLAKRGKVEAGGRLPLVHSGRLRRNMRAFHLIRATPRKSSVNMIGPRYFKIRGRGSRPNMGREVTATTAAERTVLEKVSAETLEKQLIEVPKRRRRRRKLPK